MRNDKLRTVWLIPNIFCYFMTIGALIFVVVNSQGLQEINELGIWIFCLLFLSLMSFWGSYQILS